MWHFFVKTGYSDLVFWGVGEEGRGTWSAKVRVLIEF